MAWLAAGPAAAQEPPAAPDPVAELAARPLRGAPTALAALLMGGAPPGAIVLAPLAAPLPLAAPAAVPGAAAAAGAASTPVLLVVEVDGAGLLGSVTAERLEPAVYVYAIAADGAVRGFFARSVTIDLEVFGERLAGGGVRLVGILELPPGAYELRVLVHEPASGRHGLRSTRVVLPAAATPPLAAASGAPGGSWLLAADAGGAALALLERVGLPLPAALPVLTGDAAELDLLVHEADPAAKRPPPERFEARFGDAEGRPLARTAARVGERSATGVAGVERLRLTVPLADVEPGSYFLTLAAEGAAPPPPVPVLVPGVGREHGIEWTDVLHQRTASAGGGALAAPSAPRAELDLADGKRRRGDPALLRATAAAYRAVLARLGAGEGEAAVDDLVRIEREAAGAAATDAFATLAQAEAGVLEALAAADPASLLPLVPLHLAAYERHRAEGAYALTTHSRNQAVAAAEGFAAGGGEGAARLAAAGLAVLGARLQEGQVRIAAQRLLERALELDPASRPALLRLAAGREKAADRSAAAAALRRLLAVDTKTPEGRVRLAVNLLRLDDADAEGEVLLRRLIAEHNPPWVLSLAYQELARRLLDAGRAEEAWSLLEQGAARLPDDLGLTAAHAYAAERSGRAGRARDVVAALTASPEAASPRHLYARWPREHLNDAEELLERAALLRLPALAKALGTALGDGSRDAAPAARRRPRREGSR